MIVIFILFTKASKCRTSGKNKFNLGFSKQCFPDQTKYQIGDGDVSGLCLF